jgi:predicted nucleotidyltransferase
MPDSSTAPLEVFASRAGAAILAETFGAPDRELYLRELVRLTGFAPRTIQLELNRLVATGLLTDRRDGNRRYVRAAKSHPLYAPFREIVLKTSGIVPQLRIALVDARVAFAFVFGSVAAGTAREQSDVDLLVVGTDGLRRVAGLLRVVQDALAREITPIVWTPAEYVQRRERGDRFLRRVLSEPRLMVIGAENDPEKLGGERMDQGPPHIPGGTRRPRSSR